MCIVFYFTKKIQRTFLFLSFQICNCTWKTPDALNIGEVLGQQDNDIDNWKKKLFDVMINEYMKTYEKVRSWLLQLNFVLCKIHLQLHCRTSLLFDPHTLVWIKLHLDPRTRRHLTQVDPDLSTWLKSLILMGILLQFISKCCLFLVVALHDPVLSVL